MVFIENESLLARVLEQRDQLRRLKRVVVMEGVENPSPDGFVIPWEQALSAGDAHLEANGVEIDKRCKDTQLDDVVTLIYTSGTTGPPKAVMLTHRNIAASADGLCATSSRWAPTTAVHQLSPAGTHRRAHGQRVPLVPLRQSHLVPRRASQPRPAAP